MVPASVSMVTAAPSTGSSPSKVTPIRHGDLEVPADDSEVALDVARPAQDPGQVGLDGGQERGPGVFDQRHRLRGDIIPGVEHRDDIVRRVEAPQPAMAKDPREHRAAPAHSAAHQHSALLRFAATAVKTR